MTELIVVLVTVACLLIGACVGYFAGRRDERDAP